MDRPPTGAATPTPVPWRDPGDGRLPRKPLGATGVDVSVLGIGGYTLGEAASPDEARRIVDEALDAGIDFLDNAWEYHQGKSEEWMGRALVGKRDRAFLMTKVCSHGRDGQVAMRMLEDSLRRLGTDHLDLWQIHEVVYDDDPDRHFAKGGAVEALALAKRQGKTRFIGFTGHKHPDIHLRMLELAAAHGVAFDTVQMPLNAFDASYRSFAERVLPVARARGLAVIGMKSLCGGGPKLLGDAISVEEALRYALSLPVATTVSGVDSVAVLRQNLGFARRGPLSPDEMQALRDRVRGLAGDGHLELYKSSMRHDADEGRAQHGFPPMDEQAL